VSGSGSRCRSGSLDCDSIGNHRFGVVTKPRTANPHDEASLLGAGADVLHHGVRVHDAAAAVGKGEIASVASIAVTPGNARATTAAPASTTAVTCSGFG
jgi:hypothetical protein